MRIRSTAVAVVAVVASMLGGGAASGDQNSPEPVEVDGRPQPRTLLGAPGSDSGVSGYGQVFEFGGLTYFVGHDAEHGAEPWVSDGTPEGTRMLADVRPGQAGAYTYVLGLWGDKVLVGQEYLNVSTSLYTVDPDGTVTFIADDVRRPSWTSGGRPDILAVGDLLYFTANGSDVSNDSEPWVTDGTAEGTRQIADVRPGNLGSVPGGYGVVGDQVVFAASTDEHGRELWTTDGTAAGTKLIADKNPGPADSVAGEMRWVGERLFYAGTDVVDGRGATGRELWTSDGTAEGTGIVSDLAPGPVNTNPTQLTPLEGKLVFQGPGGDAWTSDGTPGGTYELIDTNPGTIPGTSGGGVRYFTEWGPQDRRQLMFQGVTGWDPVRGDYIYRLFATDGTRTGSREVADLRPLGDASSAVIRPWRDRVIMSVETPRPPRYGGARTGRLWVSDGTPQGTWPITPPSEYVTGARVSGDHAVWSGPPNTMSNGFNTIQSLVSLELNERTTAPSTWTPPVITPPTTPTSPTPTAPPSVPDPAPARSETTVSLTGRYPNTSAVTSVTTAGRPASGTVTITVDGRSAGTATLSGGRATLRLPAWVRPGRHQVSATYRGTTTVATSTRSATTTVARATSKVRATVARKQTTNRRAVLRVVVSSAAQSKAGRLEVRRGTTIVARAKVGPGGRVTLRLPRMRPGSARLVVRWSGNAHAGASKDAVRVLVR